MTLDDVNLRLREVPINYEVRDADLLRQEMEQHKSELIRRNDQSGAKELWCLEQTLEIQERYLTAFQGLKQGDFYEAWCDLERVEIGLFFLKRHLQSRLNDYWLDFVLDKTHQLQALFPYKLFLSPEYIYKGRKCTICDQMVTLRQPCGHRLGEIYNGEMCHHLITAVEMKGLSLVTKPHQKYSVTFMGGNTPQERDDYNYELVEKTVSLLRTPFCEWRIRKTKRRYPHSTFSRDRGKLCPCGSGVDYATCCLPKPDVLLDHWVFTVDERVPGRRFQEPSFGGVAWAEIWKPFTPAFWDAQREQGNCIVHVGRKAR